MIDLINDLNLKQQVIRNLLKPIICGFYEKFSKCNNVCKGTYGILIHYCHIVNTMLTGILVNVGLGTFNNENTPLHPYQEGNRTGCKKFWSTKTFLNLLC
jgi:hypothetical protein